jgi:multicomponent Na+:H+ antiporter subunit C
MILYILSFILLLVGLFGVLAKRNLIKIIIGIAVMEYAVNLFFILIGYRSGAFYGSASLSDPLPEALIITVIAVELAVLMLASAIAVRIYQKYGTFDITKIKKLKG